MRTKSIPARQRTGARILDSALDLFNREGTSSVTTNHIAAHIGISPGNLYYWYSDKHEIIRALWSRFAAERSALWEVGDALPGPADLLERLSGGSVLAEQYAFLTREIHSLVHADPKLRAAWAADSDRRRSILTALARSWRADGALRPIDDSRLTDLVDALWVLTEAGLPHAEPTSPGPPGNERLLRAVLQPYRADVPQADLGHGRTTH